MVTNKDHEHQLEQVCSLDIHRVQSARLKGEGLPEKDELRMGIESQLEASEEKQKTRIISFTPDRKSVV